MRRVTVVFALVSAAGPAAAEDYPHVYLKNDKLKVKVYLPDAQKGFYRGTRFDWAGVLGEVEFAGHKIFGPWKEKHDPTNHDDIVGPCEEFGIEKPLGYDDAKAGGTFLKIGVGELEKPKEEKYSFAKKYKIVKPAEWNQVGADDKETREGRQIVWKMAQKANGYGYEYRKAVILGAEKDLVIYHRLQNTGEKPISTEFYNHNFFNVDGAPVGPDYSFRIPFPYETKDLKGRFGELVEVKDAELRFKDKLTDGFVMAGLTGFENKAILIPTFEMRHKPSGINVNVVLPAPLTKFNIWGVKTTICPEPFMQIDLKPEEEKTWSTVYAFTQEAKK